MSVVKAEVNALRQELMAQLPLLIAQGVREELDRRGYKEKPPNLPDAKTDPRLGQDGKSATVPRTARKATE